MKQLRLESIKAVPHPAGNRVDLRWFNPEPHIFPGVRVMRREATYPTSPGINKDKVADVESTPLFPINSSFENDLDNKFLSTQLTNAFVARQIVLSPQAVVSVKKPGNRWLITDGERMYLIVKVSGALDVYPLDVSSAADEGLRAEVVYYYAFFPYKKDSTALTGRIYIYDHKNRVSAMATGPYDFAGQMHRMLPTVYHRYDTVLPPEKSRGKVSEEDMKRGQLRRFLDLPGSQLDQLYSFAAAALDFQNIHRVDGKLLPLLAQWIGWDTDYNLELAAQRIELGNAPAMYQTTGTIPNIEAAVVKCISGWKTGTKEFVHNIFLSNRPEQLNLWLCRRNSESQKWEEPDDVFSLDFAYEGRPAAARDAGGTLWLFYHTRRNDRWDIWYKTYERLEWAPSRPFTGSGNIDKYPNAALQGQTLWVFWSSYNETDKTWSINFRKRVHGEWTEINSPAEDRVPGTGNQRKNPCPVVDHNNRLWLFWLEKQGNRWLLKYNRHNGSGWEGPSVDFPPDRGKDPRVEKDLFVYFHSKGTTYWLQLFWTRKRAVESDGRHHWCREIVSRRKLGVTSLPGGWGNIKPLPGESAEAVYDDCEPAAVVNGNNETEFFWTSNRTGSWSTWRFNIGQKTIDSIDLDTAEMLINNPYSQRAPLPLLLEGEVSVLYRSNRGISYKSDVYGATVTTDFRWSGCTTLDTRNKIKTGLGKWQKYGDFLTYTYDTGKNGKPTNFDRYARDTIGLYLTPDTDDQQLIMKNRELIRGVLKRFLPIQIRPTFIISPPLYKELIYTYDFLKEDSENPRHIKELFFDGTIPEVCPRVSDGFEGDTAEGWVWIHTWSADYPDHFTVNFKTSPIHTNFRTWHKALKAGG